MIGASRFQGKTENRIVLWYVIVGVASAVISAPSLFYDFVQDDHLLIVDNPTITSWHNLGHILTSDYFARMGYSGKVGYYRPLTNLSYLVDHTLWGLSPTGFHLTSFLWGIATTLLVFRVALSMLPTPYALLAGLLFAFHPGRVQAIGIITARSDLLAAFFCLLAVSEWLGAHADLREWWKVSLLLFVALLAKEASIAMVVILGVWSLVRVVGCPPRGRFRTWYALGLPILGYLSLRALFWIRSSLELPVSMPDALACAGRVFEFYLRTLFVPVDTATAPLLPFPPFNRAFVLLAFAPLLLPLFVLRKQKAIAVGASWVALAVGALLFPQAIRNPAVDGYLAPSPRFLYLPAIGVALLWAGVLDWVAEWKRSRSTPVLVGALWSIVLAGEFIAHLDTVRNDSAIAQSVLHDLEEVPPAFRSKEYQSRLLARKARVLITQDRLKEASTTFKEALALDPTVLARRINLAWLWSRTGHDSLAIDLLQESLDPSRLARWRFDDYTRNYRPGVELLAEILCKTDRCVEAKRWLTDLIRLFPASWKAHIAMARFRMQLGDSVGGMKSLHRALDIAPRGAVLSDPDPAGAWHAEEVSEPSVRNGVLQSTGAPDTQR